MTPIFLAPRRPGNGPRAGRLCGARFPIQFDGNTSGCDRADHADRAPEPAHTGVGAVVGGLAGLGIGSLIGGGTGRDVAMVLGTVGGAVAGCQVAKRYDRPLPGQQSSSAPRAACW